MTMPTTEPEPPSIEVELRRSAREALDAIAGLRAPSLPSYAARINRVIDYIDEHLSDPLDLHALAGVAHFSPWHFHRVFQAGTGETLAARVRRRRLEVAAGRLLLRPPQAISTIAYDLGFASAEAFSRSFRTHFGMTATQWRQDGHRRWAEGNRRLLSKIRQAQSNFRQVEQVPRGEDGGPPAARSIATNEPTMSVEFQVLPSARLAYLRYTGPYGVQAITSTWRRFARWCAQRDLPRPGRPLIGIAPDNPEITPAERCRYDCCAEVSATTLAQGEIGVQAFAGGRYTCLRFDGSAAEINEAWRLLYSWLLDSEWQPDDHPAIEIYDRGISEKAEPFSCLLCVPVRPL